MLRQFRRLGLRGALALGVCLVAGIAIGAATMGSTARYGGSWIEADGTTRIPAQIALPSSGVFTETPVATTVTTAATQVFAVAPTGRRTALFIELNSVGGVLACSDSTTSPVLWTAPAFTITGQGASLNWRDIGLVPAGPIWCIANGSVTITAQAGI